MATKYWKGVAAAVAQIAQATITGYDASTTYKVTIGGVVVSVPGNTSANQTASDLVDALNASTHPYFSGITWTNPSGAIVRGTADVGGVPFTAASSVAGGTGTFGAFADQTACTGPHHWDNAENWSDGAVPVAADVVILKDSAVSILWGMAQSAVDLDRLTIFSSYIGKIGLNRKVFATSANGVTTVAYPEYRQCYLDIESDVVEIHVPTGHGSEAGSGRIMLDLGVHQAAVEIFNTGTSSDTSRPAVRLLTANSSTTVAVRNARGGVGLAVDEPNETSTVGAVSVNPTSSAKVTIGEGVTITNFNQTGGTNSLSAAATVTAANVDGGILTTEGDFTLTGLTINGGTVKCNHIKSGGSAITNAYVYAGATLDGLESREARTWDSVTMEQGATLKIDKDAVTTTALVLPTGGPFTLKAS